MHFFRYVGVSLCHTIILIGARCQLDNVSVCCELSLGLVQGWWVALTDICQCPMEYIFLSDSNMRFPQISTQAPIPSTCLGILTGQAGSQFILNATVSFNHYEQDVKSNQSYARHQQKHIIHKQSTDSEVCYNASLWCGCIIWYGLMSHWTHCVGHFRDNLPSQSLTGAKTGFKPNQTATEEAIWKLNT